MNTAESITTSTNIEDLPRFKSEGSSPHVLTDIYKEHCNIAIWQRQLPQDFITQLAEDIRVHSLKNEVLQVGADSIKEDIAKVAYDKRYGEALRGYIAEIIDMFCVLFDTKVVGFRLSVLEKAMCPRFHYDRVPCRLVTTFSGAGTQWIPYHKVNMSKLGHASGGKPDESSGLIENATTIEQLKCGDVALLKGDTWEGNEGAALVHRSPALEPGESRLLMTLDFVG